MKSKSKNLEEKIETINVEKVRKKIGKIRKQKTVKPLSNFVNKVDSNTCKKVALQNGVPTINTKIPKAYPLEMTVEVSDIPPNHKEWEIIEAFIKYGSITYIQNISHKKAIVAFLKPEEAKEAALKGNRVARIRNQIVKVKVRSKKFKEIDERSERTIYIFRAGLAITEDDIRNHFKACGKILSIVTEKRSAEHYFIIEFSDSTAAKAALNLHNSLLKLCVLSVRLKSKEYVPWYPSRTIVMLNENNLTTLAGSVVRSIFEQYGEIENCDVFCQKSRLAMITFKEEESAVKALELNGRQCNGLLIAVELYATELQRNALARKVDGHAELLELARAKKRKVYIKKIPTDSTAKDLKIFFSHCGQVKKVNILPKKGGAVIEFNDSNGYCEAFKLHSYPFMGEYLDLVPFSEQKLEIPENKIAVPDQKQ